MTGEKTLPNTFVDDCVLTLKQFIHVQAIDITSDRSGQVVRLLNRALEPFSLVSLVLFSCIKQ